MNTTGAHRLEQAWLVRPASEPPPNWYDFFAPNCPPTELLRLLQIDLEFRARDGLPGLLVERHLDRVRLGDEGRVELIRWEYSRRWKHGIRARLADYNEAFPEHAEALRELRPSWDCPRCGRRDISVGEDDSTLCCPHCSATTTPPTISGELLPPPPTESPALLDLRHYEVLDTLGVGGMGEVYRTRDPGLERDLALKVLRSSFDGDPRLEARFRREARITAALQHPAIVPVHNLGRLPDGRLFFSMKLVRGRTLEAMLAERYPAWLGVFEQVCQAVAYAHGRGVIHRDLKPSNVMVGEYGEVQVMDWGLAAERSGRGAAGETGAVPDGQTHAGAVLGTPAYMPPEQARGERADERADVFALGAILCAALTGRPPYGAEALTAAQAGDLSVAHANLAGCATDPELVRLCKECLAPDRDARPANAGAVAERVASYRQDVEQRLRQSELDRVRGEVEARTERQRSRLRLLATASVFVLILAGMAAWGWLRQKRLDADRTTSAALSEARTLRARAAEQPLSPLPWHEAITTAEKANALARAGASTALVHESEQLLAEVRDEAEALSRDRRLIGRLLEVRGQAVIRIKGDVSGQVGPEPETSYLDAFREWGLDLESAPVTESATKLGARPSPVVREVVAALDDWALRRRQKAPRRDAARLWSLASALDGEASSELRGMIRSNRFSVPIALLAVNVVTRPTPIPALMPLHPDHRKALEVARAPDRVSVGLLAPILVSLGEERLAEQLLRSEVQTRPAEARAYHDLAAFLSARSRWNEAVECYAAARALRPEQGLLLSLSLERAGRREEALALSSRLVESSPDDAALHRHRGDLLARVDPASSLTAYRRALELSPNDAVTLNNMSIPLRRTGKLNESMRVCRQAIEVRPGLATAHGNLASTFYEARRPKEALASADRAVQLDPLAGPLHYLRGLALANLRRSEEAEQAFRRAAVLNPSDARAHTNLATMLHARGDLKGAIASARRAVAADPEYAIGQANLGALLCEARQFFEALDPLRKSAQLNPNSATTQAALGQALLGLGRKSESADASRRALKLLPPSHPLRPHVEEQLRRAEGRK